MKLTKQELNQHFKTILYLLISACPPLPKINNGYWKCPRGVFSNSVEVYASCAAQCFHGFTSNSTKEVVVRCPESLQWENFADFQCIINNGKSLLHYSTFTYSRLISLFHKMFWYLNHQFIFCCLYSCTLCSKRLSHEPGYSMHILVKEDICTFR